MKTSRIFLISVLIGATGVLAYNVGTPSRARTTDRPTQAAPSLAAHTLLGNVSVREQITLRDVPRAHTAGYRTLVDMRPDGEADGQATSTDVRDRSGPIGIRFAYIPTPHGPIPEETVRALAETLALAPPGPILLYCRSGSRAARTWALAEASRVGGAPAAQIIAAVRSSGHQIDDLVPDIERRLAARRSAT